MANFEKNKYKEFEELADESFEDEIEPEVEEYDEFEESESDDDNHFENVEVREEDLPDEAEPDVEEQDDQEQDEEESQDDVLDFGNRKKKQPQWYVVHTYSGHENKVKVNIEKIVENRGMQDLIQEIVVPVEDVVEIKDGQRKVKTRKMFPGYVLIKMIVTNESWYLVRNTQGVTGFVGHGSDPVPLTNEEILRMGIEKALILLDVEVGNTVKVTDGPFANFMGVVEDINLEKQILKVRMSVFGRETPVELGFGQVEII